MAEIEGVPEEALRAFSQRRSQVLEYLEGQGTSGFYAARVAAVEARERREELDLVGLREEWRGRGGGHRPGRRGLAGGGGGGGGRAGGGGGAGGGARRQERGGAGGGWG